MIDYDKAFNVIMKAKKRYTIGKFYKFNNRVVKLKSMLYNMHCELEHEDGDVEKIHINEIDCLQK